MNCAAPKKATSYEKNERTRPMKTQSRFLSSCLALGLVHSAWAQPIITSQPQNQCTASGTTATFTVAATGAQPLTYQWRSHTGTTAFTNILFGTEATLP